MPRRTGRCLAWSRAAIVGGLLLGPAGAGAGERRVRDVVYDYAVAGYCGLAGPGVEAGFRRELARLTEAAGLTPEEAKAERIAGLVAADEEWRNRGLGGFRAWCETEGAAASRRFLESR